MTSCSKSVRPWPSNLSILRKWSRMLAPQTPFLSLTSLEKYIRSFSNTASTMLRPIIPLMRIRHLPPIRPLCSSLFTYYVWNPPLIGNFMVTQCLSIWFHNGSYLSRSFFWKPPFVRPYSRNLYFFSKT